LPTLAFGLVEAASYILPVHLTGEHFGLWREFVRERHSDEMHVIYVLMTHPQQGPIAPTRLIVCRDDLVVVGSDADERASGLHAPFLIDRARAIISAMMAFTLEDDTGHRALAAERALGSAVDAAMRRYRHKRDES
jgi:hypothetical protein